MALLHQILSVLLHIDILLAQIVHSIGMWSYIVLFLIVFFERGCILTPFLPGDSLLFAAGALAANSELRIAPLILLLTVACFSGAVVNYWLGSRLGDYVQKQNPRWLNRDYLNKAHTFFEKYGVFAIVVCCFIPVIRTFTPFVAGMANMSSRAYIAITVFSSCLWIAGVLWASYMFGNVPFVKQHFSWFVLAMIVIPSSIPVVAALWHRYTGK